MYNNVSANDGGQDINLISLKIKVNDTYKKTENLSIKFEAVNHEDVLNKKYLDTELDQVKCHIIFIEKDYNEFKDS